MVRQGSPERSRRAHHEGLRIGFIGAGLVGTALARGLSGAGYSVLATASRRLESAQRLAAALPACSAYAQPQAVADAADLVFITTGDDAIEPLAEALRWRPGQMVVHTSGATTVDALAAAKEAGSQVACFHPLQTFADSEQALANLSGTTFALEGEEPLLSLLQEMAEALGGRWLLLRSEDKALYHAAAVMVSNYTVALVHMATEVWRAFGAEPKAAVQALLPLLQGTVANIASVGLPGALTGPIARGDVATICAHLRELARRTPQLLAAYRELGLCTVPLAQAKDAIDRVTAEELRRALSAAEATGRPTFGPSVESA